MGKETGITWTDHTFNPWWGCVRVSEGCVHCYAETFSKRTGNDIWGADKPRRMFGEKHWAEPLKWNRDAQAANQRRKVFCASMADVFETHRDKYWQTEMNAARLKLTRVVLATPWLDWLFLTKRIEDAPGYLDWMFGVGLLPRNLWIGTTAEDQANYDKRIPILAKIPAVVRWVSIEPQIGPVSILQNPRAIDWIISGGESGAGCRPFELNWARQLRDECAQNNVAFFLKQLGGFPNKRHELSDFPADLRVQDFPHPHPQPTP